MAQDLRVWTNTQGRTLKATFVAITEKDVKLRLENGTVSSVPIEQLSPGDREYLTKIPKPENQPALPPKWPTEVALSGVPEVKIIKEDEATSEFIYETEHYEFRCDAKLGASMVREIGRLFEVTHLANVQLPLNLEPKPEEGREKFLAQLFKDKQDYYDAGAIPGSWGVYMSPKKSLMVPLESLGVRQVGKRFTLDRDANTSILVHETTHQMMSYWIPKLPTWYVEGSAEYVAAAKYKQGKLSFARMGDNVVDYVKSRGVTSKEWAMWHVYHLMQLQAETLASALTTDQTVATRTYASTAILTFYFYHLDGDGDGQNFINYLKDISSGTLERLAAQRHLIRGRSYSDIEKELAQKMRRHGLDLEFTGDAGPESGASSKPQE